jgi:hypothetical protein
LDGETRRLAALSAGERLRCGATEEEEEDGMAKNVDRVLAIVSAAARLIEIETAFNAGKPAKGATAAKRHLKAAYEDYMSHHARDVQ